MERVGPNGVITVEESQTLGMEIEHVEGMQFDSGYISPYMVTDPARMEAVWEDPKILITDKKLRLCRIFCLYGKARTVR